MLLWLGSSLIQWHFTGPLALSLSLLNCRVGLACSGTCICGKAFPNKWAGDPAGWVDFNIHFSQARRNSS